MYWFESLISLFPPSLASQSVDARLCACTRAPLPCATGEVPAAQHERTRIPQVLKDERKHDNGCEYLTK